METKIFMLYGAHDIKERYGLNNFKNCIKQFKTIIKNNGLKYNEIISIIENSIIDSADIGVDPKKSTEEYVKKKTELEKIGLDKFLKKKESLFSIIKDKFKKGEGHDDFSFQLMKFLKKKKVTIVFEENNLEVVNKEVEYRNKSMEEALVRIFKSCHEVDNLRDKLMVNQIDKLRTRYPTKNFIIVRGAFHNKLSNYLKNSGFNVFDYKY